VRSGPEEPHGLRIETVRSGDPGFTAAKELEFTIFGLANGYVDAADAAAGEMVAYRPWERGSEFFIARLGTGRPVAIIRFLRYDPALGVDSFSTVHDFGRGRLLFPESLSDLAAAGPGSIAELATQAVLPGFRRPGVIEMLWRQAIDAMWADGVRVWTMALVLPLFRWYRAMLPGALTAIGHVMPDYIGADSAPAALRLDHPLVTAALAHHDSGCHRSLFDMKGCRP
jgi:hypothetical protein